MTDTEEVRARPARRSLGALTVAIFVLALVPRLAVVWTGWARYASDTGGYVMPAVNLLAGRGYVDDDGRPYAWRPPTYPLFLAAVFAVAGKSLRAVEIAQSLLTAAGAAGLALWATRRYGRGPGWATGILVALDPLLIPVPAFVLTEALGTLLVVGIVICLERGLATGRPVPLLLAGLLGGAAALNTPITLLLIPWLLLTAMVSSSPARPGLRCWALALALTAASVGGWTARNYLARGEVVVVRDNGFASLVWATTESDFHGIPMPSDPEWVRLDQKLKALVAGHTDVEAHAIFLRAAWRNVVDHPLLVVGRVVKANFWFWAEVPGQQAFGARPWLRWAVLCFHWLQLAGLLCATFALGRASHIRALALWLSSILYFAVFLSVMWPIPRYNVPVLPVLDTLIAVGLGARAARGGPPGQWGPPGGNPP